MRADFYSFDKWEKGPEFTCSVTLGSDGKAVIPASLAAFLGKTAVGYPGKGRVTPDDGIYYVMSCAKSFNGSRLFALLHEDSEPTVLEHRTIRPGNATS